MDLSFLPNKFLYALNDYDLDKLSEIRLRVNYCLKIKVGDNYYFLDKILCYKNDIVEIIKNATENSIYAHNESLKKGFITTKNGIRIGVAGKCVYDNGKILTITDFSSLNIRIPHLVKDCSKEIFPFVYSKNLYNTLIISPPFFGKTTILKDLALKLNDLDRYSILLVDERNEFCDISGKNIDVIKYADKEFAFSYGLRSMSPNVIITDELSNYNDFLGVERALYSGVNVVASSHAENIEFLRKKDFFKSELFDRYVILESKDRAGIIKNVYNGEFISIL